MNIFFKIHCKIIKKPASTEFLYIQRQNVNIPLENSLLGDFGRVEN